MSFLIVADSSANVLQLADPNYTTVPLKVIAEKEYVDDATLDVAAMVDDLKRYKGKSGSSFRPKTYCSMFSNSRHR